MNLKLAKYLKIFNPGNYFKLIFDIVPLELARKTKSKSSKAQQQ